MSKDQFEQEVERKGHVEAILLNPLHKEAWNVIEMDLFNRIGKTNHDQLEEREFLYHEMKALQRVRKYYESIIQTGNIAEADLSKLDKTKH